MENVDLDNINTGEDMSQTNIEDLMLIYNIQDDDLMLVNNDGSYVIIPMDLAEHLMSNVDFAKKVDIGFENITEFEEFVKNFLN